MVINTSIKRWIIVAVVSIVCALAFIVSPLIEKLGNDFVKSQETYRASSSKGTK